MSKPVSNKFIKGPIRSWMRDDCSNCSQVLNCIPAGSLTLDDLEYFKRSRRMKIEITPAMIAGKEMHEDILSDLQTLNEIGVDNFFHKLNSGEKIQLRELSVCNRTFGFRGVIDRFTVQRTGDRFDITIEELKSSFQKRYLMQIAVYSLIMSNDRAEIIFDQPLKRPRKKKTKRIGVSFYKVKNPIISINIKLIPVYSTTVYEKVWMHENKMSDWADGIQKGVYKYANHKRKLHKLGIYFMEDLKKPKVKSRQMFIGRRKTMVATKPYVKKPTPAII